MLKHQPCAYCGTTLVRRTKGHVFPKSLYPESIPNAERITVPECDHCKELWEDAEPHFRNILLSIWNPDKLPDDSRVESMLRGFNEKDGKRRAKDLARQFRTIQTGIDAQTKIYPDDDPVFNLILRRIVRGLAHEHKLGTAIPDDRVVCKVMRWLVPPAFKAEFTWHVIADNLVSYAYSRPDEESMHSFWLIKFSEHIMFCGLIANKGIAD